MKKQLVVNLKTLRCSYWENGKLVKEYPVGIGKQSTPTPPGNYQVVDKLIFKKMEDVDLGSRRLVLSSAKTCLHGSWNGPVEGHVSGGCVRMYNKDIEELFPQVEIGTPVIMVSQ